METIVEVVEIAPQEWIFFLGPRWKRRSLRGHSPRVVVCLCVWLDMWLWGALAGHPLSMSASHLISSHLISSCHTRSRSGILGGRENTYQRTTERHQTPTRTMPEPPRGKLPRSGPWRSLFLGLHDSVDPMEPGLLHFPRIRFTSVKDLSGTNLSVNRLKRTEEVRIRIHPIPLNDIRTTLVSDAALYLDRPDRSLEDFGLGSPRQNSSQRCRTTFTHCMVITSSETKCVCLFGRGSLSS